MSELLKLADQYYAVARDLMQRADAMKLMAENLAAIADQMCEVNMKNEAQPATPPAPAKPKTKPSGPQPGDLDYEDTSGGNET